MTGTIIPRRSERRSVLMRVQCRSQSGFRDTAEISDISNEGCCLLMQGLHFRVGARLTIRPEGFEGLPGVVRWVRGDLAGVEFDRPLYGPIVDYMASSFPVSETPQS